MAFFDVASGQTLCCNRIEKVFPKLADVLAVWGVELRLNVDRRLLGVGRKKGPAVAPAHMEGAFGAVEVAADGGLLGVVVGVEAVFPGAAEAFKLKAGNQGVRGIGIVLTDEAAAGGEDFAWVLFFGPPEELVEPVDAPIADGSVGEVHELPEASGMDRFVVGPVRGRAAPGVPVEARWGFAIGSFDAGAACAADEGANHADFAHFAALEKFHA